MPAFPDFVLNDGQVLGRRLMRHGLGSFQEAVEYVHSLPYGRVSQPERYELILSEDRGTCGTKHAFLAALANEHGADVQLMLGLHEMDEWNTPAVGSVLKRHGLKVVPEAHCFLRTRGGRLDVTHPDSSDGCDLRFLAEVEITPSQIGAWKREWHQQQMEQWCRQRGLDPRAVWRVREECVEALSRPRQHLRERGRT